MPLPPVPQIPPLASASLNGLLSAAQFLQLQSMQGATVQAAAFNGDWASCVSQALATLPTTGGIIDARGLKGTQTAGSTITIDRPVKILHNGQLTATATPLFNVVASSGHAANFTIEGVDPKSSTLTAAANGVLFNFSGDFFDFVGSGQQQIKISNMSLIGTGGSSQAVVSGGYPSTNFQNGELLLTDCFISGFGGRAAVDIGNSFYFVRLFRNYFQNNTTALRIDNNSESTICENWFFQGPGGGPNFIYIGPMCMCDHNYWYRYSISDSGNAPDIQLQPQSAWASQSGGYIWITNSRFGGEHENFDNTRFRIQLKSDPASDPTHTVIAGPIHIWGNNFIGGSSTATISYTTPATTAAVTLSAGRTTTGLSGRKVTLVNGPAGLNGQFAVASVVDSSNFTITLPASLGTNLSGSTVVFVTDCYAISLENPHQAADIRGNTFLGVSHVNDVQPDSAATAWVATSVYKDNFAPQTSCPGYTVMKNGGKGFAVIQAPLDAAQPDLTARARSVQTPYLNNKVFRTEGLSLWTASNGLVVTGGQTDPWNTTRAALLTLSGTTPSSQSLRQQIDTATLPANGRVTIKFWAKAGTVNTLGVGVFDSTTQAWAGNYQQFNLSSVWNEYKFTTNPLTLNDLCFLEFFPGGTSFITGSCYIVAPQVSDFDCDYLPNNRTSVGTVTDASASMRLQGALIANTVRADSATALTLDASTGINAAGPITFTGTSTLSGAAGLNLNAPSGTWAAQIGGANTLTLTSGGVDILQFAGQTGNKFINVATAAVDTAGVTLTIQGQIGGGASVTGGGQGGTVIVQGTQGGFGIGVLNPGGGGNLDLLGGAPGTGGTGNASGGSVVVRAAAGAGTGTAGQVLIGDANTSSITLGSTTTGLAIKGSAPTIRGTTGLFLDSGSSTFHMQVNSSDVVILTSSTVDVLQFAQNTGNKNIAIAAAPADTAGVTFTIQGQQGGIASATGGGLGGILSVLGGAGGLGTGGLNPGNGLSLILGGGGGGTGGTGNSSGGSLFARGGLKQGTGTNGNVNIGDASTHQIFIGSATGDSGSANTTTFAGTIGLASVTITGAPTWSVGQSFVSATLTNTTNQLTLGAAGHQVVLSSVAPAAASQTLTIPDTGGSDTFAFLGLAQTITGAKTFNAGTLKANNAGNTFATTFASLATAARTWTIPDATDTAVGLSTTDTLTNKTLTAPVINGASSSGSTAIDLSGSSGAFKTPTGAATFGGSSNAFTNQITVPAGTGTQTGNVPCTIYSDTTPTASVTTGETFGSTYSMPANTLSANGQSLRVSCAFKHAANTNSTTHKLYVNGVAIVSDTSSATGEYIVYDYELVRLTSSTLSYGGTEVSGSITSKHTGVLGSVNFAGAITIQISVTGATLNGDLTTQYLKVLWVP